MEIVIIPVITAVVYALIEIIKTASSRDELLSRFIPLIAGVLGMVCGLVGFYFIPGVLPTDNAVIAALIGGASGLASTGLYENIKNIFTKGGDYCD